ncbi:carbon-nitrogen hydrolase family protein [Allonocardiopsis opalescens]|uniref:Putative amidohydrolase n=1 Tax=Allonocardiopsis opalescens TaxID=1144618 RepID=A0A2T0PVA3_9ACTN|nr:carbon-nitrogen hydrolase family protein [Allonocardiopsis opalescens]PRX95459.1 putative amidohydrolase [Allonocardiopsis opalescens]
MRVSVHQFAVGEDKAANLERIAEGVRAAAAAGSRLAVFPEGSMARFWTGAEAIRAAAEPLDGPFTTRLRALSREHGIAIVAGMHRPDDGGGAGRVLNTSVAVDGGELLASYTKMHLYDALGFRESDNVTPGGPDAVTFTLDGTVVGLSTCYDLRFPELYRRLADAGAELVAVSAAWVAGPYKEDHWTTLLRARAIENTVYVAGSGEVSPANCGRSTLVDPFGVVLAGLGETPGWAMAEVDRERLAEVRAKLPSLRHRRFTVAPDRPDR